MMRFLTLIAACCVTLTVAPAITRAQENLFAPRLVINDRAISNYEVQQRALFMQLLRAPGDPEKEALKNLIDDRLRMQEAESLGISVSPAALQGGMEEFATRANLTAEQFVIELGKGGVEEQTFRDFVHAGLVWREVIRARFGAAAALSETQVDRGIEAVTRAASLRVLISELIIPTQPGEEDAAFAIARRLKDDVRSEAGFSAAVARYSAAASRERGGRLPWMPLANLPPQVAPFVLGLAPGEVSDAMSIPGGVAVFQLRGIEAMPAGTPTGVKVDYAQFLVPNDANAEATLARVRRDVDTCNDLYGQAMGLPEDQLQRETLSMSAVPADIGIELAKLDQNESSTALTRGSARVFLMLCARMPDTDPPLDREAIRKEMVNRRIAAQSDVYLAGLRANAIIREP